MADLREQLSDNQTIEKSSLIVAGTTLISVGVGIFGTGVNEWVGFGISVLGVICLITRELIKLHK